jgi:uracil-DNA glycosylase
MATADVAQLETEATLGAVEMPVMDTVAKALKTSPKTVTLKRQLSVKDMFAAATGTQTKARTTTPSDPPSFSSTTLKKARFSTTTSTLTSLRPLQSLPFSLTAFQASLSDSERALLQLECETMGKSWLKVLAPELRKPYFIKLKQFLESEGLRSDRAASKLFPPRIYP